jgi:hypothetical protein
MSVYTERTGGLLHQPCRPTGCHPPDGPMATTPLGHCPPCLSSPLAYQLQPTTGGLQHHQTLAPNLPRRHRKTGLNAKGVTPELLRLKFYCSWTGDFFFFFLFFKCLFVLLTVCPVNCLSTISQFWFLWFSFFFSLLFSPSVLVLLILLL